MKKNVYCVYIYNHGQSIITDPTFYYCQAKNFTFKQKKNIIRTHGYVYIYGKNITIHELFILHSCQGVDRNEQSRSICFGVIPLFISHDEMKFTHIN